MQNITSDVLIQRSYLLFIGYSDESGLVASQVTQMTPKPAAAQGPLNINSLGWLHVFNFGGQPAVSAMTP